MKTLTILAATLSFCAITARSQAQDTTVDAFAAVGATTIHQSVGGDTTRPPADFVAVEREPVVIVKKEPVHPPLALKAGMEGKVWVKIWVDKSGMPRDVVILKSDADIFNYSTLEAARQFRFTPASIGGKPVDVWVSVPFAYRMGEKKTPGQADSLNGGFPSAIEKFVRSLLEGGAPDNESALKLISDGAKAIVGGRLIPLVLALEEQRAGNHTIEDQERKVVYFWWGMADDGRSGYLSVGTVKTPKDSHPHYHTIVIKENESGEWKIVHWHTWHGSK